MISVKITVKGADYAKKRWLDKIATKQRQKSLPVLRSLFRQTVYGWSEKPEFGWSQTKRAGEISIVVYPTGPASDVWNLLNSGSPPHTIYAKQGGTLAFRTGYRAATRPGQLQSGRKYRSGPYRFAKYVKHPGFQARNFTEMIQAEYEKTYANDIQEAIYEALRT